MSYRDPMVGCLNVEHDEVDCWHLPYEQRCESCQSQSQPPEVAIEEATFLEIFGTTDAGYEEKILDAMAVAAEHAPDESAFGICASCGEETAITDGVCVVCRVSDWER